MKNISNDWKLINNLHKPLVKEKKNLKSTLEWKMEQLQKDNKLLETEITQLETENKVLKNEFVQLQNLITQSPILSKLMAQQISLNLPSIEQMEQNMIEKNEQLKNSSLLFTPSSSTDPAAFMYLMIVMQTFNQYFKNQNLSNITLPSLPIKTNSVSVM